MSEKIVVTVDKDLEEIMPSFLKNREKDLVDLANAISTQDMKSIKVIGHKLAGNAGGYGLDQLGEYGASLESAANDNNWDDAKKIIAIITDYVKKLEVKFE